VSDLIITALIITVPPTLVALGGIIQILMQLKNYHKAINGKLDQFIQISGDAREAKGHLKGVKEGLDRPKG